MDFFYHRHFINSRISIKPDEYDSSCFLDRITVGKRLLEALAVNQVDRVAFSIILSSRIVSGPLRHLDSLVCWAAINDESSTDVLVSSSWIMLLGLPHPVHCSHSLPVLNCSITVTKPVPLSQVFLIALSRESYDISRSNPSLLKEWFCADEPILRQNMTYGFSYGSTNSSNLLRYRLVMAEPVLQGYASSSITQFMVSMQDDHLDPTDSFSPTHSSDIDADKEGIEIDESFLASSVLCSVPEVSAALSADRVSRYRVMPTGAFSASQSKTSLSTSTELLFSCIPWHDPIGLYSEDCTVYVRTSDLGRVGLLNGDWAVICTTRSKRYRLVCVIAADDLVSRSGILMASPTFIFNATGGNTSDPSVYLRASPFGFIRPSIPIARAVTIARIASPLSIDRAYQSVVLNALKLHFDGIGDAKRLIKSGDIISAQLDTDDIKNCLSFSEDADVDLDHHTLPVSLSWPSEVVFFLVTNIEYDVVSTKDGGSLSDVYVGSTVGEMGCWVDPRTTKMIQTGLEQSRVPDVATEGRTDRRSPGTLLTSIVHQPHCQILSSESPFGKMYNIVSAALMKQAADYNLHLSILLKGARGIGKCTITAWVAQTLGIHLLDIDCFDFIGDNDVQTEGIMRARFDKAYSCSPCIFLLRHIDALMQTTQALEPGKEPYIVDILRECLTELRKPWKLTGYPVILIGTTSDPDKCSPGLLACFKHEIVFESPNELERAEILKALSEDCILGPDVQLSNIATHTAALVAVDLVNLMHRAKLASIERSLRALNSDHVPFDLICAGISLTEADFTIALDNAKSSYSESIGAPKIPNVTWDDVGGLASVKADILDTIQLPLEHPELFADGLKKRSGILLYGPPGTGKTLLAKAVATSCSLNFFSVKGPEILNMYIGESEANIRRVFQRARDAKPCVIFFDELDSVAPKRGNHGDSGGVMDRIVSQLLAELDGMTSGEGGSDVFVIGATNRPDLLDPALLRPGRFDRMLYLGVSDSHQAQLHIVEALTRNFRLHPDVNLAALVEQCPFHYTGADFYALCSDAMLKAMSRKAEEIEAKLVILNEAPTVKHPYPITPQYYLAEMATPADSEVLVSQDDFELALRELKPSVSETEMQHYAEVQRQFSEKIPSKN